jgi:hypothetical protein
MPEELSKEYLGDSVYASEDGDGTVIITTENGHPMGASNIIYLEDAVMEKLIAFYNKIVARR